MKPKNNKALYHAVGSVFDKIHDQVIDTDKDLTKDDLQWVDMALRASQQMINMTTNEINIAKTKMQIVEHNKKYGENIDLRQIEGKGFDNTAE